MFKSIISFCVATILFICLISCNSKEAQTTPKTNQTNIPHTSSLDDTQKLTADELLSKYKISIGHYCDCASHRSYDQRFMYVESEYREQLNILPPKEASFTFKEKKYTCNLSYSTPKRRDSNNFLLYEYSDSSKNKFEFDRFGKLYKAEFNTPQNQTANTVLTTEQCQSIAIEYAKDLFDVDVTKFKISYEFWEVTNKYKFKFTHCWGDTETTEYVEIYLNNEGGLCSATAAMLNKFTDFEKFESIDLDEVSDVLDIIKSYLAEYHHVEKEAVIYGNLKFSVSYSDKPKLKFDINVDRHLLSAAIYIE